MEIPEKARAFLAEKRFAVLATIGRSGLPQQTVMWYDLHDNQTIMMNTAEGRVKADNLRHDPRVSICVEDGYRFVTIAGTVELIRDQEIAQRDIAALAVRYHGEERAQNQIRQFQTEERVTILLHVEQVIVNGL